MINILICDDDLEACREIRNIISKIDTSNNYTYKLIVDPEDIFSGEVDIQKVDIVFMDIRFGVRNGIDVSNDLHQLNNKIKFIFVTSYENYAQHIFGEDFEPSGFITKPIIENHMIKVFQKVIDKLTSKSNEMLITVNGQINVVDLDKLIYIESDSHYLHLYFIGNEMLIREKLDVFQKKIPIRFIRIHKSFLVNITFINKLSKDSCLVMKKYDLPVSRSMYQEAIENFLKYKEMEL